MGKHRQRFPQIAPDRVAAFAAQPGESIALLDDAALRIDDEGQRMHASDRVEQGPIGLLIRRRRADVQLGAHCVW